MKALITATTIALAGGTTTADWEDPWQNPDLSNHFDGYTESRTSGVQDPLEESYPGTGATSHDRFVRGNPDIEVWGYI